MIYGAYGYSAELILEQAVKRSMKPVLAGRNQTKLQATARKFGLDFRVFDLQDRTVIAEQLRGIDLMLNCAGPFTHTINPLLTACLYEGCHYLDITGEIEALEFAYKQAREAEDRDCVVLPGIGFDVVPTDCVALHLKERHPDSQYLTLAFATDVEQSRGTWKSTLEALPKGGRVRQNRVIVSVPHAFKTRKIDFGDGPKLCVTIPWGDVSSAYVTTSIPNIEVYIATNGAVVFSMRLLRYFGWLLQIPGMLPLLKKLVDFTVTGPRESSRSARVVHVFGEVVDEDHRSHSHVITTPDTYTLTAHTAIEAVARVLHSPPPGGVYTPASAFGSAFIHEVVAMMAGPR